MPGDRYRIQDQQGTYFLTMTIVKWIDLFSRLVYRDVIVDSLNYCIEKKGLLVYSWVIMSNHIHLIVRVKDGFQLSDTLRDFKKFTSKQLIKTIKEVPESRREWMLHEMSFVSRKQQSRSGQHQLWKDGNHAVILDAIDIWQKVNYIHKNPVRSQLVDEPVHYLYSSARDYAGQKGFVNIILVDEEKVL